MQDQPTNETLLDTIDWIQRTGWPTRRTDESLACEIFDAWWDDVKARDEQPGDTHRAALADALRVAFEARHEKAAAQHLCALFDAVFGIHMRSRQPANWRPSRAFKPTKGDNRTQRPILLKQGYCTAPSTPTRVRLDHRVWLRVLIGLPVVLSLTWLTAAVGWWTHGAPPTSGPSHWMAQPLMPLGWAVVGAVVAFFAIGTIVVACWMAFAFGTSILHAIQSRGDVGPRHSR